LFGGGCGGGLQPFFAPQQQQPSPFSPFGMMPQGHAFNFGGDAQGNLNPFFSNDEPSFPVSRAKPMIGKLVTAPGKAVREKPNLPDNAKLFLHRDVKPKQQKKSKPDNAASTQQLAPLFSSHYEHARLVLSLSEDGENTVLKNLLLDAPRAS
jgi:hypothetical protein